MEEKKNRDYSRTIVENTIATLRQAGFFEQYSHLSTAQLFDTLHQERIKQSSALLEQQYDPGMNLAAYQVAILDPNKIVYFDTEAGVMQGNNVYVELLEAFSKASGGKFKPISISEEWKTESGPITVRFQWKGDTVVFHPQYQDDWVANELFSIIGQQVSGDSSFYFCMDQEMGYGQDVGIVRLTPTEKQLLEKAFGWEFHKL